MYTHVCTVQQVKVNTHVDIRLFFFGFVSTPAARAQHQQSMTPTHTPYLGFDVVWLIGLSHDGFRTRIKQHFTVICNTHKSSNVHYTMDTLRFFFKLRYVSAISGHQMVGVSVRTRFRYHI